MTNIGIICPSLSGHLNPTIVLAKELQRRRHRVIFFQVADLESKISQEGLEFWRVGIQEYPSGSSQEYLTTLGTLTGIKVVQYWHQEHQKMTGVFCREVPQAIKKLGIELLLVDQVESAGQAIAEYLNIPFITVCNALALNRESSIPPVFTHWTYDSSWPARIRNQITYYLGDRTVAKYNAVINEYRQQWNLPKIKGSDILFAQSNVAQISQQPAEFDFPRVALPSCFHYCGPFRDSSSTNISFPYEKLTGQPLIYASLGTLQNKKQGIFQCIAEACLGLDVQLVIAHGGGMTEETIRQLPGSPLVVSYAPQTELLAKAKLTITHAGLNTVLDSLSNGIPLVAIPIAFEQPTIAARIAWLKVGEMIPLEKLNSPVLKNTLKKVLSQNSYSQAAGKVQESIKQLGGLAKAVKIIEQAIAQAK